MHHPPRELVVERELDTAAGRRRIAQRVGLIEQRGRGHGRASDGPRARRLADEQRAFEQLGLDVLTRRGLDVAASRRQVVNRSTHATTAYSCQPIAHRLSNVAVHSSDVARARASSASRASVRLALRASVAERSQQHAQLIVAVGKMSARTSTVSSDRALDGNRPPSIRGADVARR